MNRIPENREGNPSWDMVSIPRKCFGWAVEAMGKVSRGVAEMVDLYGGVVPISSKALFSRTVDAEIYLQNRNFDELKDIAAGICRELQENISVDALKAYILLKEGDYAHLSNEERAGLEELFSKIPPLTKGVELIVDELVSALRYGDLDAKKAACDCLLELAKLGDEGVRAHIADALILTLGHYQSEVEVRTLANDCLLRFLELDNVGMEAKFCVSASLLRNGSSEAKKAACDYLLELAKLGDEGVETRVTRALIGEWSCRTEVNNYLLRFLELDNVGIEAKFCVSASLLRNGSSEAKKAACDYLLELAKLGDEGVETRVTRALIGEWSCRTEVNNYLLRFLELDNVGIEAKFCVSTWLLSDDSLDAKKAACDCLLALAKLGDKGVEMRVARALMDELSRCNTAVKTLANHCLLRFLELDNVGIEAKIRVSASLLRNGSSEAKKAACDYLLELAKLGDEGVEVRVARAFINVWIYDDIEYGPEVKARANDYLLSFLKSDNVGIEAKTRVVVDLSWSDSMPSSLKEEVVNFLANQALNDPRLAEQPDLLSHAAYSITRCLSDREEDPRYQAALMVLLELSQESDNNAYSIYREARSKRIGLREMDQDVLMPSLEVDGERYRVHLPYIKTKVSMPDAGSMPLAKHEELEALLSHLREALAHCSKDVKAMALGIPDVSQMTEAELEAKVNEKLALYSRECVNDGTIKTWMEPHLPGQFNRTKYELHALVRHFHDELTAWENAGGVHGEELSPAAAGALQLFINIVTCPSGKQAGTHLAFTHVGSLKLPVESGALLKNVSSSVNAFLESLDEGTMMAQPGVLKLIEDAYGVYFNFRSGRLAGESPFMVGVTGIHQQPSHQRDYARHVLGESLGLLVESEAVPVDIHGRVVSASLREKSGEELLTAYYGTSFPDADGETKGFAEMLVDRFHAHWVKMIDAGLNQTDASDEAKRGYRDFGALMSAAGIDLKDCFDSEYDEGKDLDIYTLKKSVVCNLLCALGILTKES